MSTPCAAASAATLDRMLVWRYIFAGLCASLDSIGLARFAFTPLLPELIQAHWFTPATAVYLGAANLAGYLCGALLGRHIAARMANEDVLRLMMMLITAAFAACAFPLSFAWYFGWRFVSGIAGGVVMVLVAATLMPHLPPARKGAAAGAIFLGLGLGIAGSGTLIPLLLQLGLAQTWLGLAVVSALLTAASWFAWPSSRSSGHGSGAAGAPTGNFRIDGQVRVLYVQYGLMAVSAVPPMVFLVDFIVRGLGHGTHLGAVFWGIYGLGAIGGPPLYGYLADRLGPRLAIMAVSLVTAVALAGFSATDNLVALAVLTVVIGTFAPGMVPLALARVHELAHGAARQNAAWTHASIVSAGSMAAAAYGFSALLNRAGGNHHVLFLIAAALLALAMAAGLVPERAAGETSADGLEG